MTFMVHFAKSTYSFSRRTGSFDSIPDFRILKNAGVAELRFHIAGLNL